ncbi:MAG TPA: T9SS type A sorting domain-containing protein [Bacteroidia bacterium]|jgi:hypothetical protein|nr:T9SS type A sorting domain-containing protein [Bacteroidia bacterium]
MKTKLFKRLCKLSVLIPAFNFAQDLAPGMNVSYTPPTGCNNQVNSISVDICNNDQNVAAIGPFIVSMYLYDSGSGSHWCIASVSINSVSAAACLPITNWNIDISQAPSVPPAGNYKLGVWVDTANNVAETNETNNTGLLSSSADIQVCAANAIKVYDADKYISVFPVPATNDVFIKLVTDKEEVTIIGIYDISGKLVQTISKEKLVTGNHLLQTDVSGMENGIYFVKIKTGSKCFSKKFVISR